MITNKTEEDCLYFLYRLVCTLYSFSRGVALISYRLWTMHFCAPFLHWNLNRLKVTMFYKIIKSNGKGWFEHRLQKWSAKINTLPQLQYTGNIPGWEDTPNIVKISNKEASINTHCQCYRGQKLISFCQTIAARTRYASSAPIPHNAGYHSRLLS